MMIPRLVKAVAVVTAAALTMCAAAPARRMVRIPAGTFQPMYGTQSVAVRAFLLDRDPVTRAQYAQWRGTPTPAGDDARRPATGVTWDDARAFCSARGARLPTLVEWEFAAAASAAGDRIAMYAARSARPPIVDRGATNAHGVRGMHDLVWEWVADPNEHVGASRHAAHLHAPGAAHDLTCAGAAIGAADPRDYPAFLRAAIRSGLTASTRLPTLGFRCAS